MIAALREIQSGPLEKSAKLLLMLSATATILICYLFAILSVVGLLIVVLFESIVMLALMRFGLGGLVIKYIRRHVLLIGIFAKNLWLPKGTDYQIALNRNHAPALFGMLDALAIRMKVALPHKVAIEMNCGAWVRLHGFRRGAGRTVLGIGYDLLVALDTTEFEAVMAHEMTHAKLVARGLKRTLNGGLARTVRVSTALAKTTAAHRHKNQSFATAEFLRRCSNAMTRLTARLVAAYSRQDEFEADRGAAEVCGAAPLRTSLLRLNVITARLGRLPWAERVSRIETESSFSEWLAGELSVPDEEALGWSGVEARDPYSTHPSLQDRLAALPDKEVAYSSSAPAITLLQEPDRIAEELIEEIHRVVAEQEQKDSLLLAKSARKLRGSTAFRWAHVPGLFLIAAGFVALMCFFASDFREWWFLPVAILLFVGAKRALVWGRYEGEHQLPVPRFAELKKARQTPPATKIREREAELEAEFKKSGWAATRKHFGVANLVEDAFSALGRCDYLRAHVATRLALNIDNKSIEAALGHAIASAGLGSNDVGTNLQFIRARAGLVSSQTIWGAAWALTLVGDWNTAEALLWKKHLEVPTEPTFLLLLSFVQQQRGKLQSAILNAEKAIDLSPGDPEAVKILAQCLLAAGRAHAAAERLAPVEDLARTDAELAILMVRLNLLQRNYPAAREWAGDLRKASFAPKWLVRLGEAFEGSRQDEIASGYFDGALGVGFFPEAHLGLARLAALRKDIGSSRHHLLAALNLEKELPAGATGTLPLFQTILNQLMGLREQENCKAWIVICHHLTAAPVPNALRGRRLMIYAGSREVAEDHLDELLVAMQPGVVSIRAAALSWNDAPRDQQPTRPVYPGVQFVLNK